jgi:hypothetical protein
MLVADGVEDAAVRVDDGIVDDKILVPLIGSLPLVEKIVAMELLIMKEELVAFAMADGAEELEGTVEDLGPPVVRNMLLQTVRVVVV